MLLEEGEIYKNVKACQATSDVSDRPQRVGGPLSIHCTVCTLGCCNTLLINVSGALQFPGSSAVHPLNMKSIG